MSTFVPLPVVDAWMVAHPIPVTTPCDWCETGLGLDDCDCGDDDCLGYTETLVACGHCHGTGSVLSTIKPGEPVDALSGTEEPEEEAL